MSIITGTFDRRGTRIISGQSQKCDATKSIYLIKTNYLSEFSTPDQRRKARENLGIYSIAGDGYGIIVRDTVAELDSLHPEIGQLVYIKENLSYYSYNEDGTWDILNNIIVQEGLTPEVPKTALWIDPTGDAYINQEGNLDTIRNSIDILTKQVDKLTKIINYGIIAGDSTTTVRSTLSNNSPQINPKTGKEDPEDVDKPLPLKNTVPHISIKMDTLANFSRNSKNLINGELIWVQDAASLYIYLNGGFVAISNSSPQDIPENTDTMTKEELEKLYLSNIGLINAKDEKYNVQINDQGVLTVFNAQNYDGNIGNKKTNGSYISDDLKINSVFLGGKGTKLDSFSAATHNFVELSNADKIDINLNGISLLYQEAGTNEWKELKLRGYIPKGGTFLIRGAKCSEPSNSTLNVSSFDMEWYDNNKLIEFSQKGATFYLTVTNNGNYFKNKSDETVPLENMSGFSPYNKEGSTVGYIDLVGISIPGNNSIVLSENQPVTIGVTEKVKDCVFVRSFELDPTPQANKKHAEKVNKKFWTHINMSKQSTEEDPYFNEKAKHAFTPKSSSQHKNIFTSRSKFDPTKPNMLTITFGRQATATSSKGATRCFNWISVGYYDEYIEYKLKNQSWDQAIKIDSIDANKTYSDTNIEKFKKIYGRLRWVSTNSTVVTTHKVILRNLPVGEYEVRARRKGDESYIGDTLRFTVRNSPSSFSYIQTTDQQAFNFQEYQVWKKSAYAISKQNYPIHFMINTGDMTQNGNRENEWIDYYNGRESLNFLEEMTAIGNNDLCGVVPYQIVKGKVSESKINHKNFLFYYCYELDEENSCIFTYKPGKVLSADKMRDVYSYTEDSFEYYMPSVYSFDYSDYHFICLNSEFTPNTSLCYYEDELPTFFQNAFYNLYKWLEKDYELHGTGKKVICYTHELPFCIISEEQGHLVSRDQSNGSKLNSDFSGGVPTSPLGEHDTANYNNGCCFSQFFQEHNIKLVMGGHKHTYSLSKPLKENVTVSGNTRTVKPNEPIEASDGVTYAMCQATGYKLQSNRELPGRSIPWLKKYYPVYEDNGVIKASGAQFYPMYSLYTCNATSVSMQTYAINNIYKVQGNTVTPFDINNQDQTFPVNSVSAVDGTNITINY